MKVRVTVVVLGVALSLAGCASAVEGTGRGSAAPSPSLSSPSTPSTPSTSAGPTAFPSSTSPSASQALLRRTPATTAVGDPVIVDFCATQGTSFLKPLGYPTVLSSVRYAAGCTFRGVNKSNQTQVGVTEYANAPTQSPVRSGGKYTTVHGVRVHVLPLDAGQCLRDVYAAGTVINIGGYALGAPDTSPKICRAADLAVQRVTALLAAHTHFRTVPLAENTVYDLDMCKVAIAAGLGHDDLFKGTRPDTNYFGADCYLSSPQLYSYIDVATYAPASAVSEGAKPVTAGSHTVLARTSNSRDSCVFFATQEDVSDGSGVEVIEFDVNALNSKKPPASMCSRALVSIGRFLDAGGLK